jgi:nucleotide-binding universal stress UspA family protein
MVSKRLSREAGHRRKFLTIIDDTPECERAVAYASKRAQSTSGTLVLLYVIVPDDFQHWLGVEKIMREEANATARATLGRVTLTRSAPSNGVRISRVIKPAMSREI